MSVKSAHIAGMILLPALLFSTVKPALHFKHLTSKDGLSSSHITSIVQDDDGFIWAATTDGLNCYDGYQFHVYRAAGNDSSSLVNNMVQTLFKDMHGQLWIGTVRGINRYDRDTDSFITYHLEETDKQSELANSVKSFAHDHDGCLYTHSEAGYIYRFYDRANQFILLDSTNFGNIQKILIDNDNMLWIANNLGVIRYDLNHKIKETYLKHVGAEAASSQFVISLCEADSLIWAGTELEGIYTIHKKTGKIGHYEMPYYKDRHFIDIYKDKLGRIWICNNNGLKLYNPQADSFYPYRWNPINPNSLSDEPVSCVFVDNQENVWCGSVLGGINLSEKNKAFVHYGYGVEKPFTLSQPVVSALMEDSRGDLWVGYYTDGIDVIRDGVGIVRHFAPNKKDRSQLGPGTVFRIMEDYKGDIWIGTHQGGLQRLDRRSGKFQTFTHDASDSFSVGSNDIRWIEEDGDKGLWVTAHGGGLNYFDRAKMRFTHYYEKNADKTTPFDSWPFISLQDQEKMVWIATPEGLLRFSPDDNAFQRFCYLPYDTTSLSNNFATSLLIDSRQRIWVGTNEGLNILNRERTGFKRIMMRQGLPNNMIRAVLEENDHKFWISMNYGISHLDLNNDSIVNYDTYDGLPGNEFSPRAALKRRNGQFIYGGYYGLTAFYPDSIEKNTSIPQVYITGIRIYNKPIRIGEKINNKVILEKRAMLKDHVVLDYKNNMITFDYVGLNYTKSEKNRYACKLEGFHDDWLDMGHKREITFTNLHPGEYTFRVKACNNDGVWNETGASIGLKIQPPFWMTWPFRSVAALFLILVLVSSYQLRVLSFKKQNFALASFNKQLESEISERTKAEVQLNASLKEKEVLLREIHHRVKNNMQIISSLLNLQAGRITDPESLDVFKGFQTRVRSMALIYEKVYGSKDLANVDLSEYLKAVTRYLMVTYQPKQQIRMDIAITDVIVPLHMALPCGLLVNEIVSNSLKFAFPPSVEITNSMIRLAMNREESQIHLIIEDNGVGFCENENEEGGKVFQGVTLVNMLVKDQLKGTVSFHCDQGTHYDIHFPV